MGGGLEYRWLCGLVGDRLPRPRPLPQGLLAGRGKRQITGYLLPNGIPPDSPSEGTAIDVLVHRSPRVVWSTESEDMRHLSDIRRLMRGPG